MRPMTYMEIAGKRYPMRFSLAAMRAVTEKYGSVDKMGDIMSGGNDVNTLDALAWIAGVLIRQGCEYKNIFETAASPEKDMPVEDGKYVPLSDEALAVALDVKDIGELSEKILEAMRVGQKKEINTETSGNRKNAEAT